MSHWHDLFDELCSSFSNRTFRTAQRGADAELRKVLQAVPRELWSFWLDERCDEAMDTALWVAVANDHVTTANLLLDAKACVGARLWYVQKNLSSYHSWSRHEQRGEGRRCLLHLAAATCAGPSMVQLLLLRRADVNAYNSRNETALHCAQDASTVRALVDAKADINDYDVSDQTPLVVACLKGRVEVVRGLLESKAYFNPTFKSNNARNPLHAACSMHHPMDGNRMAKIVAVLLVAGARQQQNTTKCGFTPRALLDLYLRLPGHVPREFAAVKRLLEKAESAIDFYTAAGRNAVKPAGDP